MNATQQGLSAGQSTRRVANQATTTVVEGGKTVATALAGFMKGFFSSPEAAPEAALDEVVAVKPSPARRTTKATA